MTVISPKSETEAVSSVSPIDKADAPTPASDASSTISTLANSNEASGESWKGNPDYFQTGTKAGKLKPRARAAGEKTAPREAGGLDIEGLKQTEQSPEAQAQTEARALTASEEKKKAKAEKKVVEAKVAAKLVMRALDLVVGWISGNTYGADFTEAQRKDRNKYRDELESDWQDYLQTLDIPMHPALVCVLGSVFYVAPAMETVKGKERVQSLKEKVISKIAVGIFNRASK